MGAKAVKLGVSSAFHSKLMQPAAEEFAPAIADINFGTPNVEFYSNLIGGIQTDFEGMPDKLAAHIVSPVRFTSELAALQAAGYENFIELGPNKVLTGLVKKTLRGAVAVNIENNDTLEKALAALSSK